MQIGRIPTVKAKQVLRPTNTWWISCDRLVRSQRSITLSPSASEFIALVGGGGEALYLKEFLMFLKGQAEPGHSECHGIT